MLDKDFVDLETYADELFESAESSRALVAPGNADSNDFVDLAKRGFFTYAFDDTPGSADEHRYRMVARPVTPRILGSSGNVIVRIASLVAADTIAFESADVIDVSVFNVPFIFAPVC